MNKLKTILLVSTFALTTGAGGVQAALVNFTLTGTVGAGTDTPNGFGLNLNDSITVTGMFDDSLLIAGTGDIDFSQGTGNNLNIDVGSISFTEADDVNYISGSPPPTLSLLGGAFDGFNFGAIFGEFGSFSSVGSSIVAGDDNFFNNNVIATWTDYSVAAVPVPAAVWLFGSGLLGLAGVARRKS